MKEGQLLGQDNVAVVVSTDGYLFTILSETWFLPRWYVSGCPGGGIFDSAVGKELCVQAME